MTNAIHSNATTIPSTHEKNREELRNLTPGDRRKRGLDGRIFDGCVLSKYFPDESEAYMPGNDR